MKAITYREYGGPEVLHLEEAARPAPQDGQVLVRVWAAALNPYDMHFLNGTPYFMRLSAGLRKPKVTGIGVDFSGVVESVGKNVTRFKPLDAVFGGRQGALAEYLVIAEQRLVKKPENTSFEQAGAVNIAANTALQAMRDAGKLQPGQQVLINGASGGVGTFAVQIAKHLGGEVTGVSSGRNTELVRSLGADHTIDYTQQDYTQGGAQYDLIVDNLGNHSLSANRRVLKPNGRYVMVGAPKGKWIKPMDRVIAAMMYSKVVHQEMGMMMTRASKDDMAANPRWAQPHLALAELNVAKALRLDSGFQPLNESQDALLRQAEEECSLAIEISRVEKDLNSEVAAHVQRVDVHVLLKEREAAAHGADEALRLAPDDPMGLAARARVFFSEGRLDDAIPLLKRSYDLESRPDTAANYGKALVERGSDRDLGDAIVVFQGLSLSRVFYRRFARCSSLY